MKELKNDFEIDIATANSRMSKKWQNRKCKWSGLVRRCAETKRTPETVAEYMSMSRDEQNAVKDVGGFVGGYLSGGVRKTENVKWRCVATIDIDRGTPDTWDDFTLGFEFAAMLYSTHKHTPEKPRYRLVFPLSRQTNPGEYEPLCRKIAEAIGIDTVDDTTYQTARLFYWPSTSQDGQFVFRVQDGPACDVDEILGFYHDYKDASEWPVSSREGEIVRHEMKKAGDPTEKPGLIGAFCRTYGIREAIETLLPEVYEKTAQDNRYTYSKGSTVAGLVCYDDKFAYSNHETDPASGKLCNAFDLCRIHLFGNQDEGSVAKDVTRLPSYGKMLDFAAGDKRVRQLLIKEKTEEAKEDFAGIVCAGNSDVTEEDTEWMSSLDIDKRGLIKPTAANIMAIIENDPGLRGRVWQNLFNGFLHVDGGLPWDTTAGVWRNTDDANLRVFMETKYGVTGKDKIRDALTAVATRHSRHPIREYLESLRWDGAPRLDGLIINYIGAEDNELNRAMTRMHFTAAVARVMEPGCKYDYCLIVSGPEGIGKSTLFSVMGGEWFSDSIITMEGKAGMEQANGGWVIELPELGSIKKSDVEQVKAYISRQNDIYRPAYGAVTEMHPRQCVFCGTTNETLFLKGETGNRRFLVIEVDARYRKVPDFRAAITADRDQLWAEAVQRYKDGAALCLPEELEKEARQRQQEHNDDSDDPMSGMLESFLEMKLPPDWPAWGLKRRRAYMENPDPLDERGTVTRTKMCPAEFICESLGIMVKDKGYKYLVRKVNQMMRDNKEWEEIGNSRHAESLYGRQRSFKRQTKEEGNDDI